MVFYGSNAYQSLIAISGTHTGKNVKFRVQFCVDMSEECNINTSLVWMYRPVCKIHQMFNVSIPLSVNDDGLKLFVNPEGVISMSGIWRRSVYIIHQVLSPQGEKNKTYYADITFTCTKSHKNRNILLI